MPQKEKITRELSLEKRAIITGYQSRIVTVNYTVRANIDAGSWILPNNSAQRICCFLPVTNTTNGMIFDFININTGSFHLVADTNTFFAPVVSANGSHMVKSINIASGGNSVRIFSMGSRFLAMGSSGINTQAQTFLEA